VRRLWWALLLALGIVAGAACVADIREPWMTLEIDGHEYDGLLVSYCWRSITFASCGDGMLREPPTHVIHAALPALVRARTRAGVRELSVSVSPTFSRLQSMPVDPSTAGPLLLDEGTHFVAISARWDRGDGLFLFGLRIERQ
jgi:hypothetical protein